MEAAWEYGIVEHHGVSVRYWLTARALCGTPYEREVHRLCGLCVVVCNDLVVVTVKRCRRWYRVS